MLTDSGLVEHIDPERLLPDRPETRALLAIRTLYESAEDEPSFPMLLDALKDTPHLELVLKAQRYAEELGFDGEGARSEFQHALSRIDLRQRKKELDELRGRGLTTREDLVAFHEKNLAYKRLQGALPSP